MSFSSTQPLVLSTPQENTVDPLENTYRPLFFQEPAGFLLLLGSFIIFEVVERRSLTLGE